MHHPIPTILSPQAQWKRRSLQYLSSVWWSSWSSSCFIFSWHSENVRTGRLSPEWYEICRAPIGGTNAFAPYLDCDDFHCAISFDSGDFHRCCFLGSETINNLRFTLHLQFLSIDPERLPKGSNGRCGCCCGSLRNSSLCTEKLLCHSRLLVFWQRYYYS